MQAKVKYNSDHQRTGINVNATREVGLNVNFTLNGDTAALTSIEFEEGDTEVYGDNIEYVMRYVRGLPFVANVELDAYEEHQL